MADRIKFLISVGDRIMTRFENVGFDDLNQAERHYLCLTELEAEVNNGGFHQFYFNRAGDHAVETPEALRAMGADRMAAIVERANSVFAEGRLPKGWFERQKALEAMGKEAIEAFDKLDNEFFEYPDDLEALAYAYVMQHKKDFGIES